MPEKRVRFALEVHTSQSLPSTSSIRPSTPFSHASALPGSTQYDFSSHVKSRATPAHPHSLLRYSTSPSIIYDFIDPPSAMLSRGEELPSSILAQPATRPPTQSMTLVSQHLPWTVSVTARNGIFISVADVIDAVYDSLRTQISETEYNLLPTINDQERASAAYRKRCGRYSDRRMCDEEKRRGMCRVDFLMGQSKFRGLSGPISGPSTWLLKTS